MENASKALLIAGGFLVTILFLSLVAYLFTLGREYSSKKIDEIKSKEQNQFNQQFLNYAGRTDLTIQDVVTIVNLAKDNNKSNKRPTTVNVFVDGRNWVDETIMSEDTIRDTIKEKLYKVTYTCSNDGITIDGNTLLVTRSNYNRKSIKFCKDGINYEKNINSFILHNMYNSCSFICKIQKLYS